MQIFSAIEEYLPNSVKALLLGSAIVGPGAGVAHGWQELSMPERPAATAQDFVAKKEVSQNAFAIRNQGDLKDIWSASQKVYAERSILDNSALKNELDTLQKALARDSSDWTVVVVAPQFNSPKGLFRSQVKEDLDKRAEEIYRDLSALERFSKDENLLLIELTPNKTSETRTAYLPSTTFSEFGPSKELWKTSIGNEFIESIKAGIPLSQIVRSTINGAESQRETRAAINQQEQLAALTNAIANFPKFRDVTLNTITQIESSMTPELQVSVSAGFELKRAEIVKLLDASGSAFQEKKLDQGNQGLHRVNQLVIELDTIVKELTVGLENLTSLRQYIITNRGYSFLDAPGRDALAEAESKADQLERELYALTSSGQVVSQEVSRQFVRTNEIVSQDLSNENFGIVLSVPIGAIVALISMGVGIEVVSRLRTSITESWQEATDKRKNLRDRTNSTKKLLDTIDAALKIKRNFMRDTMIPESLNFDPGIDENADIGAQLRSAAVQGWRVLNKLEEIAKNARTIAASGTLESLNRAHALLASASVAVEEDDCLDFMKNVIEWNEKATLEDPKNYNPPTVTFNQLHEEFVRLATICKKLQG